MAAAVVNQSSNVQDSGQSAFRPLAHNRKELFFLGTVASVLTGLGCILSPNFRQAFSWAVVPMTVSGGLLFLREKEREKIGANLRVLPFFGDGIMLLALQGKGVSFLSFALLNTSLVVPALAIPVSIIAMATLHALATQLILFKDCSHYKLRTMTFAGDLIGWTIAGATYNYFSWLGLLSTFVSSLPIGLPFLYAAYRHLPEFQTTPLRDASANGA